MRAVVVTAAAALGVAIVIPVQGWSFIVIVPTYRHRLQLQMLGYMVLGSFTCSGNGRDNEDCYYPCYYD